MPSRGRRLVFGPCTGPFRRTRSSGWSPWPGSSSSSRGWWAAGYCDRSAPTRAKQTTYECGVDPVGDGWAQTQIRYYVYAYLYVIFAVDAVYLFPWATVFAAPRLRRRHAGRDGRSSSASSRSGCCTPGAAACCGGSEWPRPIAACRCPRVGPLARAGPAAAAARAQLGPPLQPVGVQLRAGLLRDRVHRRVDGPARLHPARRDPVRARARGRPT